MAVKLPKCLIYVNSISMCERIYIWLHTELKTKAYDGETEFVENRIVEMFHAQTDEPSKNRIMKEFTAETGKVRVLIATVAVGMGIDIPDITVVISWGLPTSLLQFWQEAGRCGRNGSCALCVCFAYMRSIGVPCDICRKSGKRICKCAERVYFRKITKISECQRVHCLSKFSLTRATDVSLDALQNRNSCDKTCVLKCKCDFCSCCFNCMLKCECTARQNSILKLIKCFMKG